MSKKRKKKRHHKPINRSLQPKAAVVTGTPQLSAEWPALSVESPKKPDAPPPINKRPMPGYRNAALAIVMLAAVALGVWLAISPTMEKQRMLAHQSELLDSITQGDGVILLDEAFADSEVDFYGSGNDTPEVFIVPAIVEEVAATVPISAETPAPEKTVITGTGVLFIDSIGLKLPVTEGVSSAQLKVAVGHVPQTAPIGGRGNAVIAGHRSYTTGEFFNRLGEVAAGDTIRYEDKGGAAFTYEVYETIEVLPGDQAAFTQPEDDSIITLYTCTPIRTATHRLLVRARLIP